MRKLFIFLGIMVISLVLVGCTGVDEVKTAPSFTGIKIEDTNPVDGTEFVTFFRAKQEEVTVEIGLSNPDNLTIKSIVINGITYSSHRFDAGSTFTQIFFELNVGSDLEGTIYSVDRINYLDGENTKSVEGFSNNEFRVYVYKDLPTVERENYSITKDTITVDFNIIDIDGVIDGATLKAELYSGESLVEDMIITDGMITVIFDDLLADKFYDLKIEASYNLDDNNGVQASQVLYSGTYTTLQNGQPSALIEDTDVTENQVTFSVNFTDDDDVVLVDELRVLIFNGEDQLLDPEYTIEIDDSAVNLVFSNLLNDNEYTIKVVADYDLRNGQGVVDDKILDTYVFVTLPRSIPTPNILNLNLLENSIEFDISIDDPLSIIDEDTIIAILYIDDMEIEVDTAEVNDYHVDLQIDNLFADSEIKIRLVADYDLNDGAGVQNGDIIDPLIYSTDINAEPTVNVNELLVEQGYVTLFLNAEDINDTLIGSSGEELEAVLYEEGVVVDSIEFGLDNSDIVFEYATQSGLSYYIEIFASYNLRDGNGAVTNASLRRIVSFTAEAKAPVAEINDPFTTTETISFDLNVIDADGTIQPGSIVVYLEHDDVIVDSFAVLDVGVTTVLFDTDILSENDYTIIVEADYDLVDGSGVLTEQELNTKMVTTVAKNLPTAEYSNNQVTTETISFDFAITDLDSVIKVDSVFASLYFEGGLVEAIELDEIATFGVLFDDDILSNNLYTVVIDAIYDLNDGEGEKPITLAEYSPTTETKVVPTAQIEYFTTTKTTIEVDIRVTDNDGVAEAGTIFAVLVLDGVQLDATKQEIFEGLNTDVTFTDLYSNNRYYVRVISDLDFNDGVTLDPEQSIFEASITTDAFDGLDVTLDDIVATSDSFLIDVEITDAQSVLEGNLEAVAYDLPGGTVISSVPLSLGTNSVELGGLEPDTEYYVVIEADYDLNESDEITLNGELNGQFLFTEEEEPPTANLITIESSLITEDDATFRVNVDDDEGYVTSLITATLVQYNGEEVATFIISPNSVIDIDLTNLLSNNEYDLIFTATYDAGDGSEDFEFTQEFTTIAYDVPTVFIYDVTTWVSAPDLTVTIDVGSDDDFVANDANWVAELYVDGVFAISVALPLGEDNTNIVTFPGYDHTDGSSYTVVVKADIDMNEFDALDPEAGEQTTALGSRTFVDAGN